MKALLLALGLVASAAGAQTLPDYSDNRSSAADVIASLYNAINRHEYLRAYSYYQDGTLGFYSRFAAGYGDTARVDLRVGQVTSEGAAGTLHHAVPVALRAVDAAGHAQVYIGCYQVIQVNPDLQDTPPFQPILIADGHTVKTDAPFDTAMGTCP